MPPLCGRRKEGRKGTLSLFFVQRNTCTSLARLHPPSSSSSLPRCTRSFTRPSRQPLRVIFVIRQIRGQTQVCYYYCSYHPPLSTDDYIASLYHSTSTAHTTHYPPAFQHCSGTHIQLHRAPPIFSPRGTHSGVPIVCVIRDTGTAVSSCHPCPHISSKRLFGLFFRAPATWTVLPSSPSCQLWSVPCHWTASQSAIAYYPLVHRRIGTAYRQHTRLLDIARQISSTHHLHPSTHRQDASSTHHVCHQADED